MNSLKQINQENQLPTELKVKMPYIAFLTALILLGNVFYLLSAAMLLKK